MNYKTIPVIDIQDDPEVNIGDRSCQPLGFQKTAVGVDTFNDISAFIFA